jgi:hypothetical protein
MDSFEQLKGAVGNFSTSLRLLSNKPAAGSLEGKLQAGILEFIVLSVA